MQLIMDWIFLILIFNKVIAISSAANEQKIMQDQLAIPHQAIGHPREEDYTGFHHADGFCQRQFP